MHHLYLSDVRERAYAAMLGSAVGDALGACVEFMTPSEIRAEHGVLRDVKGGGWLHLSPGQVTDDTEMSLCIARSLDRNGWSLSDIADRFATWLKSRPIDVGNTCRRGIRRYVVNGTLSGAPNEGDAGNGAAMRMTPVAIASLADSKLLEQWAIEQAHVTHYHPLSDAACLLVGRLVHGACIGKSRWQLLRIAEAAAERTPPLGFSRYRGLCSAFVGDTMKTVLHHFFRTSTFEDCLIATVNAGGDTDTAGAIVGSVAGAYYGPEEIPPRWVNKLDRSLVKELGELSTRLVERSPLGRGDPGVS